MIAFTCCFVTVVLMVFATTSSEWMKTEGWREGLFQQCVSAGWDENKPLPFGGATNVPGCSKAHDAGTSYVVVEVAQGQSYQLLDRES